MSINTLSSQTKSFSKYEDWRTLTDHNIEQNKSYICKEVFEMTEMNSGADRAFFPFPHCQTSDLPAHPERGESNRKVLMSVSSLSGAAFAQDLKDGGLGVVIWSWGYAEEFAQRLEITFPVVYGRVTATQVMQEWDNYQLKQQSRSRNKLLSISRSTTSIIAQLEGYFKFNTNPPQYSHH